jgi:predicted permease
MRIPVAQGRGFTAADHAAAPRVVVVNRTAAERFWPGASPVGARIRFFGNDPDWWTIVGVTGDVRHFGLESEPRPELYMAFAQGPPVGPLLAVRTTTDPSSLAGAVRRAIHEIDRDVVISNEASMSDLVSASVSRRRLTLLLLSGFAVAALGLAGVGLYGLLAYLVAERRQELGVRLALGATPRDLFTLVVGQGLTLTGIGLAIGMAASLLLSRAISSLLYRTSPLDPVALIGVTLVLLATAAAACAAPARRAARADPMLALRAE